MTKKEYNGWYNFETWQFALWFNPEDFAEDMESIVKDYQRAGDAVACLTDRDYQVLQFADYLKDWFDDFISESVTDSGIVADLLTGAVSEINFQDVSQNWLEDFQSNNSTQGA